MDENLKRSILESWNEAEELHESLCTLTNKEIIECKEALKVRALKIMTLLNDYITVEDVEIL